MYVLCRPTLSHTKQERKARVTRALPDWRDQLQLAYQLLRSDYSEEQQIGTRILVANLCNIAPLRHKTRQGRDTTAAAPTPAAAAVCNPRLSHEHTSFAHEFIDALGDRVFSGGIRDWGNCDSLSSRVVCELIKRDPSVADKIREWKDADCMWKRRSACVSFVKIARFGDHSERIIDICTSTVRCQERFVQLGTGWVLRELSLADRDLVVQFIKDGYAHFTREGLRYAIEKMSADTRRELLGLRKVMS